MNNWAAEVVGQVREERDQLAAEVVALREAAATEVLRHEHNTDLLVKQIAAMREAFDLLDLTCTEGANCGECGGCFARYALSLPAVKAVMEASDATT